MAKVNIIYMADKMHIVDMLDIQDMGDMDNKFNIMDMTVT